MRTTVRVTTLLTLLALSTACGTNSIPTAPTGPAAPTASVPPNPEPPPPAEFPPVSGPARVYSEAQPLYPRYSSRYVLYEDGTFAFQMNHPSEARGTYHVINERVTFRWSLDERWESSGLLTDDALIIFYNEYMRMYVDFVDGVYTGN